MTEKVERFTGERVKQEKPTPRQRPPSAIDKASAWSYYTFSWMGPIIRKGYRHTLTQDDLQDLCKFDDIKHILDKLTDCWQRECQRTANRPSLTRVMAKVYGPYYLLSAVAGLLESLCKIAEAMLLGYIVRFFQDFTTSLQQGLLYALAISLITIFHATLHHHFFWPGMRTGTHIRMSLIALMYQKALRLTSSSAVSTGAIVNMISNDVQPFENASPFANYIWLGPVEFGISAYFLYRSLGVSAFAGLAVLFALVPVQGLFAKRFSHFRERMVKFRDDRVRTVSDVLSGINLVKFSAWEDPMQDRINAIRQDEVKNIRKENELRAMNEAFFFCFPSVVELTAFACFWALGNSLRPDIVFTSVTLFNVIRLTMTSFVPKAVETISECRVSVKRITEFMLLPELEHASLTFLRSRDNVIEINHASFSWESRDKEKLDQVLRHIRSRNQDSEPDSEVVDIAIEPKHSKREVLTGINFEISNGELLAVVGTVGSGKSSLCMALLRELTMTAGTMAIGKHDSETLSTAYCAQSPWIFAGSIRDNILFGEKYDEVRFRKVIEVCALQRDLTLFPDAENTLIGEKGVTLSGGQRARISLARAVYSDADMYILDDPLSAVDAHVGRHLFDKCIKEFLSAKTVILVTHQLQYLKDCDNILVLDNGKQIRHGPVVEFIQPTSKTGAQSQDTTAFMHIVREFMTEAESMDTSSHTSASTVKANEEVDTLEKDMATLKEIEFTEGTELTDDPDKNIVLGEEEEYDPTRNMISVEDQAIGSTPLRTYIEFFRIGSPLWMLLLLTFFMLAGQVSITLVDWWLSRWASKSASDQRPMYNFAIFIALVIVTVFISVVRAVWVFKVMLDSSQGIFRRMLDAVVKTDAAFFQKQPHGRILNRFSKDQSNVDELLPYNFFDALQIIVMLAGSIVLICVVNYWVIISLPFVGAIFVLLRQFYMRTSRQVKRIESVTRSPVYSLLSESLDGLPTIRAFTAESRFLRMFVAAQNDNMRAYFMYIGSARWLGFRCDVLAASFLSIATFACVGSRSTQSAGLVGLSLSYLLGMVGSLQWAVRQSIEVEITFISVERMLEYTKLPAEAPRIMEPRPPKGWPSHGTIDFKDTSLRYPGTQMDILRQLNFSIQSCEKVGIVGRTGAGKSSILTAIFRLVEPSPQGSVVIDGLSTSDVGTFDLRSKLSIIPQEPFLFKGNLRFNLDPFNEYSDERIWKAIDACELKNKVQQLPNQLLATVAENGKNFSVGERQLISLCRAILRETKIIVMDEATANIDLASDRLIQKAISTLFRDATVLTIAHRLNTVIGDYDRIMVLEAGEIVEFDEPWVLLQKPDGWLSAMVRNTGPESERNLREIAHARWSVKHDSDKAT